MSSETPEKLIEELRSLRHDPDLQYTMSVEWAATAIRHAVRNCDFDFEDDGEEAGKYDGGEVASRFNAFSSLYDALERVLQERDRLKEALRPFVPKGYHATLDGPVSDGCPCHANFWFDVTVGDLRRARQALSNTGGGE